MLPQHTAKPAVAISKHVRPCRSRKSLASIHLFTPFHSTLFFPLSMLAPLLPLLLFTSPILSLSFPNSAHSEPPAADPKPAYFVLAGDSTTAKQSDGGGGWGNGFLATLQAPAA